MITVDPSAAQVGAAVSVHSQERVRGEAVSGGRPVARIDLSYDRPDGFYLGGSASIVATRDEGLRPFGVQASAGYAHAVGPDLTVDLGISHSAYTQYSRGGGAASYTEIYAGMTGRNLSGHVFFSPRYFRADEPTLYAELDGNVELDRNWTLVAHVGALARLSARSRYERPLRFDWRLGAKRRLGRLDIDVAWVGHTDERNRYDTHAEGGGAVVVGATLGL